MYHLNFELWFPLISVQNQFKTMTISRPTNTYRRYAARTLIIMACRAQRKNVIFFGFDETQRTVFVSFRFYNIHSAQSKS